MIDGPDGAIAFDAGLKDTGSAILAAAGGRLDRVILSHAQADAIYTLDAETGQPASARVPHPFSNWDTEMARESIRRLLPLEATSVWVGHSESVSGEDVAEQLERAAGFGLGGR